MRNDIKISVNTNQLPTATINAMWAVYAPFYHYTEADFRARIHRNTHYALYREEGRIVGFTGLRIEKVDLDGDRFLTIYFGQTVVMDHVRGRGLINRTGLCLLHKFPLQFLTRKVVFWADALTYRAYLVFAKNLVECYPSRQNGAAGRLRKLRDHLGETHYGDRYCPRTGTVTKDAFLVRDPQVLIEPKKLRDADIRYFARSNPDYEQGRGLLTLGPGTWENIKYMVKKAMRKRKRSTTAATPERVLEAYGRSVNYKPVCEHVRINP